MKKVNLLIVVLALVGFAIPSFANSYGTGMQYATCSASPQGNTGESSKKIADGDLVETSKPAVKPAKTGSEE